MRITGAGVVAVVFASGPAWGGGGLVPLPSGPALSAEAWSVNDWGLIVGYADADPALWWRPHPWTSYRLEVLDGPVVTVAADGTETSQPYESGIAVGVNEFGEVVAFLDVNLTPAFAPRVAIWDYEDDVWRDLGRPEVAPGVLAPGAQARGINNHGDVVGSAAPGNAVVWFGDGGIEVLPRVSPAEACSGFAINDVRQVTGWCRVNGVQVPVRWDDGVPVVLEAQGNGGFGRAINIWGTVVGFDPDPAAPPGGAAVLWYEHETPDGRTLEAIGAANGIDDWGNAVGYQGINGEPAKAALWRLRGSPILYEPLAGDDAAWFRAIGNTGLMVGFSTDAEGTTAVYARR